MSENGAYRRFWGTVLNLLKILLKLLLFSSCLHMKGISRKRLPASLSQGSAVLAPGSSSSAALA